MSRLLARRVAALEVGAAQRSEDGPTALLITLDRRLLGPDPGDPRELLAAIAGRLAGYGIAPDLALDVADATVRSHIHGVLRREPESWEELARLLPAAAAERDAALMRSLRAEDPELPQAMLERVREPAVRRAYERQIRGPDRWTMSWARAFRLVLARLDAGEGFPP